MVSDVFRALDLKINPFPPGACKDSYFHTESTKRFLEELHYGVLARKGFFLLAGEVGHGKTSLLLQLLPLLEKDGVETAWVFNTVLDKTELIRAVARDFGLCPAKDASLAEIVDELHTFFLEQARQDRNCAIIIDEAHNLDLPALEGLRMLSNLERDGEKLVQILLVGQPELMQRMQEPELRQFRSRINIFLSLPPLDRDETANYVNFKLSAAGSQLQLRGKPLDMVWTGSGGSLRMINLIMEKTLYALVAANESRITEATVSVALQDIAPCHGEVARALGRRPGGATPPTWLARAGIAAGVVLLLVAAGVYFFPTSEAEPPVAPAQPAPAVAEQQEQPEQPGGQAPPPEAAPRVAAAAPTVDEDQAAAPDPATSSEETQTPPETFAAAPEPTAPESSTESLPEIPGLDPVAAAFLRDAGLIPFAGPLQTALDQRDPTPLAAALPESLQLVTTDKLPPGRGEVFHALPWRELADTGPRWVVVWEPRLRLGAFKPDMRGDDVLELQRLLTELGLYDKAIDGRYGKGTWQALRSFQKAHNLPATGEPTEETMLWLSAVRSAGDIG